MQNEQCYGNLFNTTVTFNGLVDWLLNLFIQWRIDLLITFLLLSSDIQSELYTPESIVIGFQTKAWPMVTEFSECANFLQEGQREWFVGNRTPKVGMPYLRTFRHNYNQCSYVYSTNEINVLNALVVISSLKSNRGQSSKHIALLLTKTRCSIYFSC